MDTLTEVDLITVGKNVIQTERDAVSALLPRIDAEFERACQAILQCKGRVVVSGMGKSGHIANKIAATFASTGTPAFFMHPAEASHGDLGMITREDVLLALSYSGESQEILTLLPGLKRLKITLIAMTGSKYSSLAKAADIHLNVSVSREACPLDLAPTSSTTVSLVMGDALAISLLEARGFTQEDFARSHPGGRLGRRLLLTVGDIMRQGELIPQVTHDTPLKEALIEMSRKGLGMTGILNENQQVIGILTDGDLRRALDRDVDLKKVSVSAVMTTPCTTLTANLLAVEALNIIEQKRINGFLVVDEHNHLIGAFNMHDLLKHGVL